MIWNIVLIVLTVLAMLSIIVVSIYEVKIKEAQYKVLVAKAIKELNEAQKDLSEAMECILWENNDKENKNEH